MTRLRAIGRKLEPSSRQKLRRPPKLADAELLTPEHKAWAEGVIFRAGFRCEWVENGKRCERGYPHRLVADHKTERKDSGAPLDPANGQCLCFSHHTKKTALERSRRLRGPATAAQRPGGVGV